MSLSGHQSPAAMPDLEALVGEVAAAWEAGAAIEEVWGLQFDLGLAWPHLPVGRGGLGTDPSTSAAILHDLRAAGVPAPSQRNPLGIGMAGPTIAVHGDDAQLARHLRSCFTAAEIWCQLFSEPGAGSDLANVATRAEPQQDGWRFNGQKVWTSMAEQADLGLLLARHDATAPKHEGLTFFLLDMRSPGVDVRPIKQLNGSAEFSEVYLHDVHASDDARLGAVGDGWRVAITTLMNERVALTGGPGAARGSGHIGQALRAWEHRSNPVGMDGRTRASQRARLLDLWVRSEAARLTAERAERARERGVPGPEGSIGKLVRAELQQEIYDLCMDLEGPEAFLQPGYDEPFDMESYAAGSPTTDRRMAFLYSFQATIAGGTSEVLRNIVGERILGLPEDVRVDKGIPWNRTRRT